MTIKNRVNSSNRDTQEHVVERRSRRLVVSVLTMGVMLGILIAPFLLVENGLAAGGVADEPCLTCPLEASVAADAAWYSGMPSLVAYYTAKTEANLAADQGWYDLAPSPTRAQRPVISPAFGYKDEWHDLEYWSLESSPARAVRTEMGPASGSEYVWENEWYGVDDPSKIPVNTTRIERTEIPCGPWTRGMVC